MAIVTALFIFFLVAVIAMFLSKGKSRKRKYIIWGIANIVAIGPSLSFAIGLIYVIIEKNGWAAMLMLILYPIIFVIGLIQVIIGIFMKKSSQ